MSEREDFIATLQACYIGDINALNEIVSVYDNLQQEKQQLKQALLDIKEYIETNSYFKDNIVKTMVLGDYSKGILDIVNKALGSDSNG